MSHALRHFLHRGLSRGWVAWHAIWQEAARKRASARRGLSHLMNRKLSLGWRSWAELVAERREAMQLMRKGLSMLVNRRRALGFVAWRDVNKPRTDDPMSRAMKHVLHRGLSRGWMAWAASAGELRRKRDAGKRGLSGFPDRVSAPYIRASWSVRECMFTLSLGDPLMQARLFFLALLFWYL